MKTTTKRFALGTAVAALGGLVTGLLTAPKSGKETRQDIKDVTTKSVGEAEKQLKKLHTELQEVLTEGKKRTDDLKGKAKEEMDSALESTKNAKEKVRDVLSTIHEGQAPDRDLGKAVKEAQKAVEHLKNFLKK